MDLSSLSSPKPNCALCPRLAAFRTENSAAWPSWHNGPVPSFGGLDGRLLIVGLAPGLKGANRTGRPFTGDYAGDLLYPTLDRHGLTRGRYQARADDGLTLDGCRITNAVRCVPPANKPTGAETATCRTFLAAEIQALTQLRVILALGTLAHGSVLAALGLKKSALPFGHGAIHQLADGVTLADSYHCSRYNTNTRRLTVEMFDKVFETIRPYLD